jgi:hypothetical protein
MSGSLGLQQAAVKLTTALRLPAFSLYSHNSKNLKEHCFLFSQTQGLNFLKPSGCHPLPGQKTSDKEPLNVRKNGLVPTLRSQSYVLNCIER